MVNQPFADSWEAHWHAGWHGLLLLPTAKKAPPPNGYTGAGAIEPSYADAYSWAEDSPTGNIALHMPRNVFGLDCDVYHGGKPTMLAAIERWGDLPPTWYPSARDDGSGIRLYRIPEGLKWPGKLDGGGVETVHAKHRYAVIPSSIHPDTGQPYVWHMPDRSIAPADIVPSPDSLPLLPEAWVVGLTNGEAESELSERAGLSLKESIDSLDAGDCCGLVRHLLDQGIESLKDSASSRHDTILSTVYAIVGALQAGHTGGRTAIQLLGNAYIRAITAPSHGGRIVDEDEAQREFQRMVHGAVDKLYVENAKQLRDPCKDPLGELRGMFSEDAIADQLARLEKEKAARERQADRDLGLPEITDAHTPTAIEQTPDTSTEEARPGDRIRKYVLRRSELDQLPEPKPMIAGVLNQHSYCLLVGRDASFKSFVALDWALCLATGKPWQQHASIKCNVLYLAAEGAYGMKSRTRAWENGWNAGQRVSDDSFAMFPYPVNIAKPEAAQELIDYISAENFGLVVVDTLGRSVSGADQNAGEAMSIVTENLDRMWRATKDGSVLVVAHTGKTDIDARGYSGLEDDSSIVWAIKRPDDADSAFTMINRKQKDQEVHPDMNLYTAECDDSLIVLGGDRGAGSEVQRQVRENQKSMIISMFWQAFEATGGASMSEIYRQMGTVNMAPTTVRFRVNEMKEEGLLYQPEPGKNGHGNYRLSEKGRMGRDERMQA